MNDHNGGILWCLLTGAALFFFLGGILGGCEAKTKLKSEAIKYGVAEYNQTNGVWQWKPAQLERVK